MRLGTVSVSVEAVGLTKYNSDLKKAGARTDKFGNQTSKSVGKTSSALKTLGLVAGSVLGAAVLGKLVKDSIVAFKNFETATVDMAKVTTRSLKEIRSEVLGMSSVLGTSTDLMKGYYQVISAGVTDPVKSLQTLTTASQLAKSAHIDQAEAIKGLTKLMAGYEGQIKTTAEAADLLFTIEKEGQTSVLELIPVIGGLAKVSADLAVSTNEMGASLATLSKTAGSTSIAATQYKMILFGLFKPQENMLKIFDALNVSTGRQLVEMNGLAGALKLVKQQANTLGIGLGKIFESTEALTGISALASRNFEAFNSSLEAMKNKTGASQKAWEAWKQTLEASLDTTKANFEKLKIAIVGTFGKETKTLVDDFATSIESASTAINAVNESTSKWKDFASYWLGFKHIAFYYNLFKEVIEELPVLWITLREYFIKGFLKIERAFKITWAGMKEINAKLMNAIIGGLANMLDKAGRAFAKFNKTAELGASLRNLSLEFKKGLIVVEKVEDAEKRLNAEYKASIKLLKEYTNEALDAGVAQEAFTEHIWQTSKAFEDARKSIEGYGASLKSNEEFATSIGDNTKKAFSDARENIDGYVWHANTKIEELKDESGKNFQGMADFYKDALLQMVDGTGSFVDMIKGKLKNLAASIGASVLTSLTGSVLKSIPGVGGLASMVPGMGGGTSNPLSLLGAGKTGLSIFDAFKTGGIKAAANAGLGFNAFKTPAAQINPPWMPSPSGTGTAATGFMSSPGMGMAMGGAGALAGGYGMYSAYKSGSPMMGGISGAGAAMGVGAFGAAAGATATGSAMGLGALSAAGGPVGIIIGAIIGSAIGYAGKLSAARKLHRVHRAERYLTLLARMSFGEDEDDPFDINKYDLESFLNMKRGDTGVSRFKDASSIHAVQKYGGVKGSGGYMKPVGESIKAYELTVEEFGGATFEALEAGREVSKEIKNMKENMTGLNKEGQLLVDQFVQLGKNAKALQLIEISKAFDVGDTGFVEYIEQINRMDLGDQEETALKYAEALKILTDTSIPAYSDTLEYAYGVMSEAKKEMEAMADEAEHLVFKTSLLESGLVTTGKELVTLRDTASTVNLEMLNLKIAMGLLDEEMVLVSADTGSAIMSAEWFTESATWMRNALDQLNVVLKSSGELLDEFKIHIKPNHDMRRLLNDLYDLADALDKISSLVSIGTNINESGKDIIETFLAGDWVETESHLLTLADNVSLLGSAFEALNLFKLAKATGPIGQIIAIGVMVLGLVNGAIELFKKLFGDKEDIISTPQKYLDAMNPVTDASAISAFGSAIQNQTAPVGGVENMQNVIDSMKHEKDRIIAYIVESDSDWAKAIKEIPGWMDYLATETADAIEDFRKTLSKPFRDLAEGIQSDINSISGINNLDSQISLAKSEFNDMAFDNEDYLTKAQELRSLILERYALEKSEIEGIKSAFESVYDSISSQLLGMQTSSDNPRDIYERMGIQLEEVNRLKDLYGSTTGLEQAGYGGDLSTALGDYLKLSQEAYQRPSSEYQAIFDMVTSELRMIQDSALNEMSVADIRLESLQTQTVTELKTIKATLTTAASAIDGINTSTNSIAESISSAMEGDSVKTSEQKETANVYNLYATVNIDDRDLIDFGGGSNDVGDAVVNKLDYALRNTTLRKTVQEVANG